MYDDWLKKNLWKKQVEEWTSKFKHAKGEEWHKVYQEYLRSSVWAEKRREVLSRANYICESCGAVFINEALLDVHHLTYDRVGGNEKTDDLQVLCYPCHQKGDKRRRSQSKKRHNDLRFQNRLSGFATVTFGDDWEITHDPYDVELAFITYLYKKYCKEMEIDFHLPEDPETDLEFLEFWDSVVSGDY